MDNWYYSWDGEQFGPVTRQSLQQLIDKGMLQRSDLVWTTGMPEWQIANSVADLVFPEQPPPLPRSQAIPMFPQGDWGEVYPIAARWLRAHKPVALLLGTILFGILWSALLEIRADDVFLVPAGILTLGCGGGLVILGMIKVSQISNAWQRRTWLQKKWESATGNGGWIRFSQDGGVIRNDGFSAKYTFHSLDDIIELRPMNGAEPVQLKIVLLSEKDLALDWNGQTLHYEKPNWWKRVFGSFPLMS